MSKYVCSTCGRNAKLPDFCCGKAMSLEDTSVFNSNNSQVNQVQGNSDDVKSRQ